VSWLTKMSLRNRSIVGLVVLAVVVFGAIAVSGLKQELIPDLTFPYLTVFTADPGTSPRPPAGSRSTTRSPTRA